MDNAFLDAMWFRHATKAFDQDKRISDEDFNTILEIGRLSPSSFGFEPWKFVVVQDRVLREKMKSFSWGAQGQLETASHFILVLARKQTDMVYSSDYIQHMMNDVKQMPEDVVKMYSGFYEQFQKVDFDLLSNERNLNDWSMKQVYIALGNMMTGAAYIGVDSCPMEGFDYQLTEQFIAEELNLDTEQYAPAVMVAFGYRKEEPRPKTRQTLDSVVAWY